MSRTIKEDRKHLTNKRWEKVIADKMWDECPKCGYKKDITDYDLW